jgi:predicted TIM-barrel fold metal-dependent hydrolase
MDHRWADHRHWMEPKVDEPPSFYFKRQFWATFEDDRAGVLTRELIGVERLMWGSDYPHTERTFPHSREQIAKDFAGIPEAEVSQMVAGNAARLYGLWYRKRDEEGRLGRASLLLRASANIPSLLDDSVS